MQSTIINITNLFCILSCISLVVCQGHVLTDKLSVVVNEHYERIHDTGNNTLNLKKSNRVITDYDDLGARLQAASANEAFFLQFFSNFASNVVSYISYLDAQHMTIPQPVANYYYHMGSMDSEVLLVSDMAQSFPFEDFKTFITAFPWYPVILQMASATTVYVPGDFMSTGSNPTSSQLGTGKSDFSESKSLGEAGNCAANRELYMVLGVLSLFTLIL